MNEVVDDMQFPILIFCFWLFSIFYHFLILKIYLSFTDQAQ